MMKFYEGDVNELVEELNERFTGVKGRRKVKSMVEEAIEEITGLEHTFSANRDSYHHFHIPVHENGGGHSIFVSYKSNGVVKDITKY